jgi:hypothetical protein
MGAGNSSGKKFENYKLKIIKETDEPFFFKSEKQGDTYVLTDKYDLMSGRLVKVETGSYVYEGKEKKTFSIFLDDGGTSIKIEGHLNGMTRTMLNTICGADSIGMVELSAKLWGKKGEKKYPTVFVEVNGQKSKWRYQFSEIPAVEHIKNKKGETVSSDDSEANDFYINTVIPEINSKIQNEFLVESEMKQPVTQHQTHTSETAPDSPDLSDLPF